MSDQPSKPWWDEIAVQASGDVIMGDVGAGAKNVAIGKNITQSVTEILGDPTPDDGQIIASALSDLTAAIADLRGQLGDTSADMAEFQVGLLEGELAKTGEDDQPSASTITQVGDWLLDNVPDIFEILTGIFATPAVGRVVGKAGQVAVEWVKTRFGKSAGK